MAHPFKNQASDGRAMANKRYPIKREQGGPVPDYEYKEFKAKDALDVAMQSDVNRPASAGKRFHDSGLRIPGRLKAENDAYSNRVKWIRDKLTPKPDEKKRGGKVVKKKADGGPATDSDFAEEEERLSIPKKDRSYGDPEPMEQAHRRLAKNAREAAAERVRKSRAMPDAFPLGGEKKRGGKVK